MNAATWTFQGFWPFVRKELSEWWRGRGALATAGVLTALGILGTLSTRIDELGGGTPTAAQLDPTRNILGAQFQQWIVFAALFASIGMLASGARGPWLGPSPSRCRAARFCSRSGQWGP